MVLKIQALQKRLIAKTEEAVEKGLLIQARRGGGRGGMQARPLPTISAHVPRRAPRCPTSCHVG
jgi:hypothetical protein